jgi:ubiquinone/menaquinone biosynthesis C-methylase UbiE
MLNQKIIKVFHKLKKSKKKNINYQLFFLKKIKKDSITKYAYNFQSGSYISHWKKNKRLYDNFNKEIKEIIIQNFSKIKTILDCGCGELTNTKYLIDNFKKTKVYGFDFSLNRLLIGLKFFKINNKKLNFTCSSLLDFPYKSNSFDLSITMHAIEPNKNKELKILSELVRVSTKGLLLIEPDFLLANKLQKKRMKKFGYITQIEKKLNELKLNYRKIPLKNVLNKKNKSSAYVVILKKKNSKVNLADPITKENFNTNSKDSIYLKKFGLLYPIINTVPILKKEMAIHFPKQSYLNKNLLK